MERNSPKLNNRKLCSLPHSQVLHSVKETLPRPSGADDDSPAAKKCKLSGDDEQESS